MQNEPLRLLLVDDHLIALGKSHPEIAEALIISPKTVSNQLSNIFSKLQVVGRTQAVLRARQAGWG